MLRFSRQWRGVYTKELTFDSCQQALRRCFATSGTADESSAAAFTEHEFHGLADSALESLQDQLDALIEEKLEDGDVTLEEGVLTIGLGSHGTYVLNKQAPNKQIWSSSPVSGPARYDWQDGKWVYKRGGIELFQTLSEEMSQLLAHEAFPRINSPGTRRTQPVVSRSEMPLLGSLHMTAAASPELFHDL